MKTLVSRLNVACHHRSGKYRTWMGWDTGISGGVLSPTQADSLLPATDLTSLDGALQGPCRWCQGGVDILQPGQSCLVGVELRCLLRGIQEPALGAGAARLLFGLWLVSPKSQLPPWADLASVDHF